MSNLVPGYKVYGSNAALSVELSMTKASERFPKGQHTIRFEMASFNPKEPDAVADWSNKLTTQVTVAELPQVVAVLGGHAQHCEFKFHGQHRNKSYRLANTTRCELSISGPGRSHTITLLAHQRFEILSRAMRQLQRQHGALPSELIYTLLVDCYRASD